jgi:hypothetical protein
MATTPKTGNEPFVVAGRTLPFRLSDFWRWSASDLLGNAIRGVLAEFIVGRALGLDGTEPRAEWDAVDLRTSGGLKIEVKSAAYLQSWEQPAPSKIIFGIAPAKRPWDAATNTALNEPGRQADVYVFCLFREKDRERADPLDLGQWVFFVLPTRVLDEKLGDQKTVGLGTLERIGAMPCTFNELRETVGRAVSQGSTRTPPGPPTPG